MDKAAEWCHDCAEGWDYHRSLGVALCPLHAAAPALLEALEDVLADHEDRAAAYGVEEEQPHRIYVMTKARAAIAQAKEDK